MPQHGINKKSCTGMSRVEVLLRKNSSLKRTRLPHEDPTQVISCHFILLAGSSCHTVSLARFHLIRMVSLCNDMQEVPGFNIWLKYGGSKSFHGVFVCYVACVSQFRMKTLLVSFEEHLSGNSSSDFCRTRRSLYEVEMYCP